jgi:hypothetical protein
VRNGCGEHIRKVAARHKSADVQAVYTDITQYMIDGKYAAKMLDSAAVRNMMDRRNPDRIKSRLDKDELDREQKVDGYCTSIIQNPGSMLSYTLGLESLYDEVDHDAPGNTKPVTTIFAEVEEQDRLPKAAIQVKTPTMPTLPVPALLPVLPILPELLPMPLVPELPPMPTVPNHTRSFADQYPPAPTKYELPPLPMRQQPYPQIMTGNEA